MRYLFSFPVHVIADDNGQFDPFEISEWNDKDELPKIAIDGIKWAYQNDRCYTLDNFVLCFNLGDSETCNSDNILFSPDDRFKDVVEKLKITLK